MMKKVYVDESISRPTICEWFKRFKVGLEDLNDYERSVQLRSAVNEETFANVCGFIKEEPKSSFQRVKRSILNVVFYLGFMNRFLAHIRRIRPEYRKK